MSNWPLLHGVRSQVANPSGTGSTTLTASASAHAKGAYAQIIAATGFAYEALIIGATGTAANNYLVDLAIGGAGAEINILTNAALFTRITSEGQPGGLVIALPLAVPAGSRLSARCQSSAGSATMSININGLGYDSKGQRGFRKAIGLGDTATSRGITVDPGGTGGTEGAWTQLIASTSDHVAALALLADAAGQTVKAVDSLAIDLAIGASGSERIVLENLRLWQSSVNDRPFPVAQGPYRCAIPAASRIAARIYPAASTATQSQRTVGLCPILMAA